MVGDLQRYRSNTRRRSRSDSLSPAEVSNSDRRRFAREHLIGPSYSNFKDLYTIPPGVATAEIERYCRKIRALDQPLR